MSLTIPVMTPQNFSIPAGYNETITFDVNPAITPSLDGMVVLWRVYAQQFGIPAHDPPPVFETTATGLDSPLSFTVQLMTEDTIALRGNYYHEASILDETNQVIGGSFGIMTVVATMNRESGILS